jgi:hypothetical protein
VDAHIKLNREDKKNLHKALWNIYQPTDAEDWKAVDKIKDDNLNTIKRILDSLPPFLEYEQNGNKLNYIPEDYSWSMMDITLYPKSVPEVCEWLENAIKGKNRDALLLAISSIFYMTYML